MYFVWVWSYKWLKYIFLLVLYSNVPNISVILRSFKKADVLGRVRFIKCFGVSFDSLTNLPLTIIVNTHD